MGAATRTRRGHLAEALKDVDEFVSWGGEERALEEPQVQRPGGLRVCSVFRELRREVAGPDSRWQTEQRRGCPTLKGVPLPLRRVAVSPFPLNNWNCLKMLCKNSAQQVILVRGRAAAESRACWGHSVRLPGRR